jgi:hypothetical protein
MQTRLIRKKITQSSLSEIKLYVGWITVKLTLEMQKHDTSQSIHPHTMQLLSLDEHDFCYKNGMSHLKKAISVFSTYDNKYLNYRDLDIH